MPREHGRRLLAPTLAVLLTVISGCATVSAPPQQDTRRPLHTYAEARAAADALWDDYSGQAARQTTITNVLYGVLSVLGAPILGLGVTGTAGAPITALGLAGAFSYGAGTWFARPEHLAIYKAGADAIGCIRDKSTPLGSAEAYATLLDTATKPGSPLEQALSRLTSLITELREFKPDSSLKTEALADAAEVETSGRDVLTRGRTLVRQLNEAGDQMWRAVEKVDLEVKYGIRRATDPRDIMAHIQQNVVGTYRDLIGLSPGVASTAESAGLRLQSKKVTAPEDALRRLIDRVHVAVADVVRETKSVSSLMEASSIAGVSDGIAQCLASAQGTFAVPRIQVSPTSVTLAPGKSETVLVIGTTSPSLQKIPSSAPVAVTPAVSNGNTAVTIKADDKAAAGEYSLHVTAPIANNDTVERTVRIVVTSGSTPAAPAGVAPTDAAKTVNQLLLDKGWTCGEGKTWTLELVAGGGQRAILQCNSQTDAQKIIDDHAKQAKFLTEKNKDSSVTAEADGKLKIVVPKVDDAQFKGALQEALKVDPK